MMAKHTMQGRAFRRLLVVILLPLTVHAVARESTRLDERTNGSTLPSQEQSHLLVVPRTGELVPIPTTDAEALRLLDYASVARSRTLQGLYATYRAQGFTVLEALTQTLRALERAGETQEQPPSDEKRGQE